MSKAHTGMTYGPETREKLRALGYRHADHLRAINPVVKGQPLPLAHREAIARGKLGVPGTEVQREKKRGPNNPRWKDGRPNSHSGSLGKAWSKAVKRRANGHCEDCGAETTGRRLHAHHVKPFKDFPALRFELSNGRALCAKCHGRAHVLLKASQLP